MVGERAEGDWLLAPPCSSTNWLEAEWLRLCLWPLTGDEKTADGGDAWWMTVAGLVCLG